MKELLISFQELQQFVNHYEIQGLLDRRNRTSDAMIFYENKKDFKTDCLVAPSSVTIYMTDFCPKYCRHCATNSHNRINKKDEFGLNDWIKIIRKLREAGVFTLVISGGEPLSLSYAQQFLDIADEMNFGLILLTDFDDLSKQQINGLKSLKRLINIQTSLDGATAETHDFLRGKGSFAKTLKRLRVLSDAGLNFTIATAVHKKNIYELDKIADLANDYSASSVYLNAVAPYGRAKERMKDLLLDEEDLKHMAQTYLYWVANNRVGVRNPFWKSELHHLGDDEYNPFVGTLNAMSLGIYNFTISSKGDCYLDAKQRAEKLLKLGNITKNDFTDMWNDPRLDKLRTLYSSEQFTYTQQSKVEMTLGL